MSLIEMLMVGLLALVLLLLVLIWARQRAPQGVPPGWLEANERLERELRDELGRSASGTRQELLQGLAQFQHVLTQGLQGSNQSLSQQALAAREAQDAAALRHAQMQAQAQAESMQRLGEAMREQLQALSKTNDQRLAELRLTVEQRLTAIQQDNEKKLEQMRATVDEKLHATLEQRLGESFKQVAERLEQVHKGLGEMQNLARDVGSLNRVLTNVKTRGVFGEVQLAGLLDQVFAPEQYASNVATLPGSSERVEFAIRLPGQRDDGQPLWLPIDAKFPREDYERLIDAQERADAVAVEEAARALEARIRAEARTIAEKYVAPPHTTDFALLFLPTEGLYAEILRRPGLTDLLQRDYRVTVAGPTTLTALLNSLQMGFRTLAIEKRSSEVWQVLGAVKTEFGKFGDVLARTKSQLETVTRSIEAAEQRTRVMNRNLKQVEALPGEAAAGLLGADVADIDEA